MNRTAKPNYKPRPCEICGTQFEPASGSQKRCGSRECSRAVANERQRRFRERRPDYFKESQRKYRQRHPDRVRQSLRNWAQANPAKAREYQRRFYRRHPEANAAKVARWRDRHPEKHAANQDRNRARHAASQLQRDLLRAAQAINRASDMRRITVNTESSITVIEKTGLPVPPPWLQASLSELDGMDVAELVEVFHDCMRITSRTLLKAAAVLYRLEQIKATDPELLGDFDPASLRVGFWPFVRLVAFGRLLPEIATAHGNSMSLLRRISTLPLPDQKALLDRDGVDVAVVSGDGGISSRRMRLSDLTPKQVRQVFAFDHVRNVEEQAKVLRADEPQLRRVPRLNPNVQVDRRRGVVRITAPTTLSRAEVLRIVEMFAGEK